MDANPALDSIFTKLKAEIDQIIGNFWQAIQQAAPAGAATAANPTGPKYKALPWFQHGVKGFLNKLWHGDHPENPTWKNVQREGTQNRLKLQEYIEIKSQIDAFLEDVTGVDGMVAGLSDQIMKSVAAAFQQAYAAGYERSAPTASAEPAAPEAAPAPEQPPTPTDVKVEPPTAAANQAVKTPKPRGKRLAPIKPVDKGTPAPEAPAPAAANQPNNNLAVLDNEQIQDTALKITVANDEKDIHHALKSVGIPVTSAKRVPAWAIPNVVRVMHYLASNGDLDLHKNDWRTTDVYGTILKLKLPSSELSNAIQTVGLELADQRMKSKGDMSNVAAAASSDVFDSRESVKAYKKLLREGDRTAINLTRAKSLKPQQRAEFFKECLASK